MMKEEVVQLLGILVVLLFLASPILIIVLFVKVDRLGKELEKLKGGAPANPPAPVARADGPSVVPAPVAPAVPPPLPVPSVQRPPLPVAPSGPSPLVVRLRDIGLLPPAELAGESALGAWWAARVGGLIGVAAAVFLGIWLNLTSELPAWLRLAQVVLIGAAILVGGLNLALRRPDLGRVLTALGATVLQFSAWASQGLDRMRVVDSPSLGVFVQLVAAAAVAALALSKSDRLLAQLATSFAAASLIFGVGQMPGSALVSGAAVACVALLGAAFLVRAGWFSAAVIGLVGSQLALLRGGLATTAVVIAVALAFLANWGAERLVRGRGFFRSESERLAFSLASFLLPVAALLNHASARPERPAFAFVCAAVAGVLAFLETKASPVAASSLLAFALGLAAAGGAWTLDQRLDWIVWFMAGGLALFAAIRTSSSVLRWASEGFVMVAALSFASTVPSREWHGLLAAVLFSVLLGAREKARGAFYGDSFLSAAGGLSLVIVLLSVQDRLPNSISVLPWLAPLAVDRLLPSPALRIATVPSVLWSLVVLTNWGELAQSSSHREPALWSALVTTLAIFAVPGALRRGVNAVLRHALCFLAGYAALLFTWHLSFLLPASLHWRVGLAWALAGLLFLAIVPSVRALVRRLPEADEPGAELSMFSWGVTVSAFVQMLAGLAHLVGPSRGGFASSGPLFLHACLLVLGLAAHLRQVAVTTASSGEWGTVQRALLPALWLGMNFILLRELPGVTGSLGWAIASMLTFLTGHFVGARALRMVGLVGLAMVAGRIVVHDVTDLLGRVLACAGLAAAFFAVAWVYGRLSNKESR